MPGDTRNNLYNIQSLFKTNKKVFKITKFLFHIGLLDLKIIAIDTILLLISISTTLALPGTDRVSNEAKFFQEVKF